MGSLPCRATIHPTRNFAVDVLRPINFDRRDGHFCHPPYVAAGDGPSLALRDEEGRRMVSEDPVRADSFLRIFRRGLVEPHTVGLLLDSSTDRILRGSPHTAGRTHAVTAVRGRVLP